MTIQGVKTPVFQVGDSLADFVSNSLRTPGLFKEGSVIAVTSKIVSLSENNLVPKDQISKSDLIKREADRYLGVGGMGVELTIKHGILIPSAGIDESNSSSGHYILFPNDPYLSAQKLHRALANGLAKELGIKNFGVLITDSCPPPLRQGVLGVALSHWGFKATRSYVGAKDLFGRELRMTQVNVIDALAVSAVFAMGEGDESTPIAVISGAKLEYAESASLSDIAMKPEDDLYSPLFKNLFK